MTNKQKVKLIKQIIPIEKTNKQILNEILDKLYTLEDKTNYENKNIGKAINLLQDALPYMDNLTIGQKIYVILPSGKKYQRKITWLGENKLAWNTGWSKVDQVIENPDKKSKVKHILKLDNYVRGIV